MRKLILIAAIFAARSAEAHPWPTGTGDLALADRIAPPPGFNRRQVAPGSFGEWLRGLPIKPGRPPVHLFDGRLKRNQDAHFAVIDIDVGSADLQQCADAVIRLFAEYQWAQAAQDQICFRFTSGDPARWSRFRDGERPEVRGSRVRWMKREPRTEDYRAFRAYLDLVFLYAGTRSLAADLAPVPDPSAVEPGDVFVQGGSPGHAVLVIDVAENARGERVFLLAQSFMPAQEIQLLKNPEGELAWYRAAPKGELATPEWRFERSDLRRFGTNGCPERPH